MKLITAVLFALTLVGCASQEIKPRTVWINGYAIPENCLFVDEQWSKILPAIGSDNIKTHAFHTSGGTVVTTKIADETYICNRTERDVLTAKERR